MQDNSSTELLQQEIIDEITTIYHTIVATMMADGIGLTGPYSTTTREALLAHAQREPAIPDLVAAVSSMEANSCVQLLGFVSQTFKMQDSARGIILDMVRGGVPKPSGGLIPKIMDTLSAKDRELIEIAFGMEQRSECSTRKRKRMVDDETEEASAEDGNEDAIHRLFKHFKSKGATEKVPLLHATRASMLDGYIQHLENPKEMDQPVATPGTSSSVCITKLDGLGDGDADEALSVQSQRVEICARAIKSSSLLYPAK